MIIDQLVSNPGLAVSQLQALRGPDGFVDLSAEKWDESLAVVKSVTFDRIHIHHREIRTNFVDCLFDNCRFAAVSTDAHFLGARDKWRKCHFAQSLLKDIVSPQNEFDECLFESLQIDGYRASQTTFRSCKFSSCKISSLHAVINSREAPSTLAGATLQFFDCQFDNVGFSHCSFAGVMFRRCAFEGSAVENCSFSGIDSDVTWWPHDGNVELFLVFLDQVLVSLSQRVGQDSKAVSALRTYRDAYREGAISSRDYSACLYTGSVPDSELDIVEEIFEEIGPRFGM